jgi:hypothetical protein
VFELRLPNPALRLKADVLDAGNRTSDGASLRNFR